MTRNFAIYLRHPDPYNSTISSIIQKIDLFWIVNYMSDAILKYYKRQTIAKGIRFSGKWKGALDLTHHMILLKCICHKLLYHIEFSQILVSIIGKGYMLRSRIFFRGGGFFPLKGVLGPIFGNWTSVPKPEPALDTSMKDIIIYTDHLLIHGRY